VNRSLLTEVDEAERAADLSYVQAEIPKAFEQTLDGVDRVAKIVRSMKEFSHVDQSSDQSPADLNRALENHAGGCAQRAEICRKRRNGFGELPQVICHLGDMNQVFLNLLVNAAHAIGDVVKKTGAKGAIRVRTRQVGDEAEIAISDTGTGIPYGIREKIFEPFFTTKEVGKGTGQGLALARVIVVEKHGGKLTFDSEIGKGTTFYIRLPLAGVKESITV